MAVLGHPDHTEWPYGSLMGREGVRFTSAGVEERGCQCPACWTIAGKLSAGKILFAVFWPLYASPADTHVLA